MEIIGIISVFIVFAVCVIFIIAMAGADGPTGELPSLKGRVIITGISLLIVCCISFAMGRESYKEKIEKEKTEIVKDINHE